ncbi:hypothetical protein H2248_011182 [Termitomyces sp. 'cryptogamus']|nr:hypothetical protein H2248_011182 [Termitomyces sp. 'cryptogamus']
MSSGSTPDATINESSDNAGRPGSNSGWTDELGSSAPIHLYRICTNPVTWRGNKQRTDALRWLEMCINRYSSILSRISPKYLVLAALCHDNGACHKTIKAFDRQDLLVAAFHLTECRECDVLWEYGDDNIRHGATFEINGAEVHYSWRSHGKRPSKHVFNASRFEPVSAALS